MAENPNEGNLHLLDKELLELSDTEEDETPKVKEVPKKPKKAKTPRVKPPSSQPANNDLMANLNNHLRFQTGLFLVAWYLMQPSTTESKKTSKKVSKPERKTPPVKSEHGILDDERLLESSDEDEHKQSPVSVRTTGVSDSIPFLEDDLLKSSDSDIDESQNEVTQPLVKASSTKSEIAKIVVDDETLLKSSDDESDDNQPGTSKAQSTVTTNDPVPFLDEDLLKTDSDIEDDEVMQPAHQKPQKENRNGKLLVISDADDDESEKENDIFGDEKLLQSSDDEEEKQSPMKQSTNEDDTVSFLEDDLLKSSDTEDNEVMQPSNGKLLEISDTEDDEKKSDIAAFEDDRLLESSDDEEEQQSTDADDSVPFLDDDLVKSDNEVEDVSDEVSRPLASPPTEPCKENGTLNGKLLEISDDEDEDKKPAKDIAAIDDEKLLLSSDDEEEKQLPVSAQSSPGSNDSVVHFLEDDLLKSSNSNIKDMSSDEGKMKASPLKTQEENGKLLEATDIDVEEKKSEKEDGIFDDERLLQNTDDEEDEPFPAGTKTQSMSDDDSVPLIEDDLLKSSDADIDSLNNLVSPKPSNNAELDEATCSSMLSEVTVAVMDDDVEPQITTEACENDDGTLKDDEYEIDTSNNVRNFRTINPIKTKIAETIPKPELNHLINFWMARFTKFSDMVLFCQYLQYHIEKYDGLLYPKVYQQMIRAVADREPAFESHIALASNIPAMCELRFLCFNPINPDVIYINPEVLQLQVFPLALGLPSELMFCFTKRKQWKVSELRGNFIFKDIRDFYQQLQNFVNDRPDLVIVESTNAKDSFPQMSLKLNDRISTKFLCFNYSFNDISMYEMLHLRNDYVKSLKQFMPQTKLNIYPF